MAGADRTQRGTGDEHGGGTQETARKGGRTRRGAAGANRGKTAGTNRDYDEQGESMNQGHGHPRERRGSDTE